MINSGKEKSVRMPNSSSLIKQEFLKKWIKALQTYTTSDQKLVTISQRKEAIKLSADVAIASTRNPTTRWSRAVLSGTANPRTFSEKISSRHRTITCRNKILWRSRRAAMKARRVVSTEKVKNRISAMKRLVPGGEGMKEEGCLIKETLDYIAGLRVQVDVMRQILAAKPQSLDSNIQDKL